MRALYREIRPKAWLARRFGRPVPILFKSAALGSAAALGVFLDLSSFLGLAIALFAVSLAASLMSPLLRPRNARPDPSY